MDVSGQNSEFLRSRSVEGPDPRPRGALDFKILASTISAITFGKQSKSRRSPKLAANPILIANIMPPCNLQAKTAQE